MSKRIYLDYAATTPLRKEVLEAMLPYFSENFGNPSSIHQSGQQARITMDKARVSLARKINCNPEEIIFTSGGTESNNLAIKGLLKGKKGHIITSTIEHSSIKNIMEEFEQEGFSLSYIPVGKNGIIDPQKVKEAIREDTILISVMYANNEIGTIQPIHKIGRIAEDHNILFHCDAVQVAASIPLDVKAIKTSSLSLSAHKIYGPKGIGLLYVKKSVKIAPQQVGGGQEHRRRSGTENIPGIIGFANALEYIQKEQESSNKRIKTLRDIFIDTVLQEIPETFLNGDRNERLINNANICFPGVNGESLLMRLDMAGIDASAGSACSAGSLEASHVLLALGLSNKDALSSLRFTFGKETNMEDVKRTIERLKEIISDLRTK